MAATCEQTVGSWLDSLPRYFLPRRTTLHACTCPRHQPPHADIVAVGLLLAEQFHTAATSPFTLRGHPYQHIKKRLHTNDRSSLVASPARVPSPAATPPPTACPAAGPASLIPTQQPAPMPEPADLDLTTIRPVLARTLPPPPAPSPGLSALNALAADAAYYTRALLSGSEQPAGPDTGSDLAHFTTLEHEAPFRQAAMDHLGLDIVGMRHLNLARTYGRPAGAAAYPHRYTIDHDVLDRAQADI